jgi:hypothetical protein
MKVVDLETLSLLPIHFRGHKVDRLRNQNLDLKFFHYSQYPFGVYKRDKEAWKDRTKVFCISVHGATAELIPGKRADLDLDLIFALRILSEQRN